MCDQPLETVTASDSGEYAFCPEVSRRNPVPSYLHHAPSGQSPVRIDGKDHDLGPYGSEESKAEFDVLVRKLLNDRLMVRSARVFVDGPGEFQSFEPIAAEELADGQEPVRLGTGPEFVAPAGMPQRGLEPAGTKVEQAGPAVPMVSFKRGTEQPQVALAPPARIRQALPGAAGRTEQNFRCPGWYLGVMTGHGWVSCQASSR